MHIHAIRSESTKLVGREVLGAFAASEGVQRQQWRPQRQHPNRVPLPNSSGGTSHVRAVQAAVAAWVVVVLIVRSRIFGAKSVPCPLQHRFHKMVAMDKECSFHQDTEVSTEE